MSPIAMEEQLRDLRDTFGPRCCLHPESGETTCSPNIIRSHTVQRGGTGLNQIARNGKVYCLHPEDAKLIKQGKVSPRLIGFKEASTFTGFCGTHDTAVFLPIETEPLRSCSEHAFLLYYRAICRELYMKRGLIKHLARLRQLDRGAPLEKQIWWQRERAEMERGEQSSLRHLERWKLAADHCLVTHDYSNVRFYAIWLDSTPEFMCSGCVLPDYDFHGRRLQVLTDLGREPEMLTFSVLGAQSGGVAFFSWIGSNPAAENFVTSLEVLPEGEIGHALTRFAFEYVENIFLAPDWWEILSSTDQAAILGRANTGILPGSVRPTDRLRNDGVRVVSWTVTQRSSIIEGKNPLGAESGNQ